MLNCAPEELEDQIHDPPDLSLTSDGLELSNVVENEANRKVQVYQNLIRWACQQHCVKRSKLHQTKPMTLVVQRGISASVERQKRST